MIHSPKRFCFFFLNCLRQNDMHGCGSVDVVVVPDNKDMTSAARFHSVPISFAEPNKATHEEPIKLHMKSLKSAQTTCKMKFEGEEDHANDKENGVNVEELHSDCEECDFLEHPRFSASMTSQQSSLHESNVTSSSNDRGSEAHPAIKTRETARPVLIPKQKSRKMQLLSLVPVE
jgi:hypothetical protein